MCGNDLKENLLNSATLVKPAVFSGVSVVIAPHPDDESLGCGGTIATLKKSGKKVFIVFVSDGSMSHPSSKKYPAPQLKQLRKVEALAAAAILGIAETDCFFMMLKDDAVPNAADKEFTDAAAQLHLIIEKLKPQNIFLPYKNDPHKDHQACWQIALHAILNAGYTIRLYYYFIWFWERGNMQDKALQNLQWIKVDVSEVLYLKKNAIAAHISQTSELIDDDANGFTLSPAMIAYFTSRWELFATD
jgi:LmbE family N-acetylglucosaminyl deacetylase